MAACTVVLAAVAPSAAGSAVAPSAAGAAVGSVCSLRMKCCVEQLIRLLLLS